MHFESYTALNAALALHPIAIGAFRFAKQYAPATFTCARCKQSKPLNLEGGSTGYGVSTEHMAQRGHVSAPDQMLCFICCGQTDSIDMIADGKATLYLTHPAIARNASYPFADGKVTNWPGTLTMSCRVKRGRHNIAGSRYDAWFTGPDGKPWHGVQYGENTQILHCRRVKR